MIVHELRRPLRPAATAALLLLLGCRFRVLLPAGDEKVEDLAERGPELAAPDLLVPLVADLYREPDLLVPDLAGPCSGRAGVRLCSDNDRSAGRCSPSDQYEADRACTGAGCDDGHCRKPAPAKACAHDADCAAGQSCQLFTTIFNSYGLYCAPAPGVGALGDPCQRHADCFSNTCFPLGSAAARCLRACVTSADCGAGSCGPTDPLIEGFRTTSSFCSAP